VALDPFAAFLDVSLAGFRVSIGLRLRVRALQRSELSSSSSSSVAGCGVATRLRAADRVVGPKYDGSRPLSDGVGLGEITRGVEGMLCLPRPAMV
jgi:hypothetical protein